MPRIHSGPSYPMGDVSGSQQSAARLREMQASLRSWQKMRQRLDGIAAGTVESKLTPAERNILAANLAADRYPTESRLAATLHGLLTEVYGSDRRLPSPDVRRNPDAAVQLSALAMQPVPDPTGLPFLIPLAMVGIGGLALVWISKIRSDADLAKERDLNECIKAGACTDHRFWLKAGAVVFLGWFAWEKLGLKKQAEKLSK